MVGAWVDDRRVADGVGAAGNAYLDLPERNLVADMHRSFEAGAACTLHVHRRCLRIEPRGEHAFARQVVILGMLDDSAGRHVAEALALQFEALDHAAKDGGEHVLVAQPCVSGLRPRERNTHAADDGDAPDC